MESSRFDQVARLFAERRLSRRTAMVTGGAGLAAAALGSAANAQDATPEAETEHPSFLFVQTFGAGAIASGDDGLLTLTADHLAGQTVYFSDRPERIVGMVATERFLGQDRPPSVSATPSSADATPEPNFGFTPADPPNAALVFASAEGEDDPGDVLVVELIDPTYDPSTGLATYALKVLADESAVDLTLVSEPVSAADAIRSFEAASLFIDDCPNGTVYCITPVIFNQNGPNGPSTQIGMNVDVGFCYDWASACCWPCGGPGSVAYTDLCNSNYPACQNSCYVNVYETFVCNF